MTSISILGTGNVGTVIASIALEGCNTAQLLGSEDTKTPVTDPFTLL
ncbi:hypothetical protein [Arthrobacter sp. MAHUQ-56]